MKVRFHPQAWVNDYAMSVDPEGETEFEVPNELVSDDMEDDDYPSDELHLHDNAPQWVKNWSGPFWIEILREEQLNEPVT